MNENEEDIENIEKIAEGLINNHHHIEKERKKKFSKKTNRFHELNLFLNTIPTETKKLTRDEKKIVEYQRRFDQMEEVNSFDHIFIERIKKFNFSFSFFNGCFKRPFFIQFFKGF